jgi:hypothetical protein
MEPASTTAKSNLWPTPQDYNEAVQNLHVHVKDPDLKSGHVELGSLGLPKPRTGAFASVYRVDCPAGSWALRCFLRNIPDVQWRYERISQFVQHDTLTYTVAFDFQPAGISVGGLWYPLLKMDWVGGETLDNFMRSLHPHHGHKIHHDEAERKYALLAERFKTMCADLINAGIAHGDLQHGNIMVDREELFLVDYDGMYVPSMAGSPANELGHRNYQHPARNANNFGPQLDNFSAWVIYTSLRSLALDQSLYDKLGAGEDCLLFRQRDFQDPLYSCTFRALEEHSNEEIKRLGRFVRWLLQMDPDHVPALSSEPTIDGELAPLASGAPRSRAQERTMLATGKISAHAPSFNPRGNPAYPRGPGIEPELMQPTPRSYEFNGLGSLVTSLLSVTPSTLSEREMLVTKGAATTGEIIEKLFDGEYWLSFLYQDAGLRTDRIGSMSVKRSEYNSVSKGDKLTVLYIPETYHRMLYKFSGLHAIRKAPKFVSPPATPAPVQPPHHTPPPASGITTTKLANRPVLNLNPAPTAPLPPRPVPPQQTATPAAASSAPQQSISLDDAVKKLREAVDQLKAQYPGPSATPAVSNQTATPTAATAPAQQVPIAKVQTVLQTHSPKLVVDPEPLPNLRTSPAVPVPASATQIPSTRITNSNSLKGAPSANMASQTSGRKTGHSAWALVAIFLGWPIAVLFTFTLCVSPSAHALGWLVAAALVPPLCYLPRAFEFVGLTFRDGQGWVVTVVAWLVALLCAFGQWVNPYNAVGGWFFVLSLVPILCYLTNGVIYSATTITSGPAPASNVSENQPLPGSSPPPHQVFTKPLGLATVITLILVLAPVGWITGRAALATGQIWAAAFLSLPFLILSACLGSDFNLARNGKIAVATLLEYQDDQDPVYRYEDENHASHTIVRNRNTFVLMPPQHLTVLYDDKGRTLICEDSFVFYAKVPKKT